MIVPDPSSCLCLTLEARHGGLICSHTAEQDFEGYLAADDHVLGQVDRAHAALTEKLDDSVFPVDDLCYVNAHRTTPWDGNLRPFRVPTMTAKSFLTSATIATALLLSAPPAGAQTKEQKADARAAAEAGGDAFDAGKWAEAADLFERAERLMHAPPHLLFAARAHAKLGHLVQARELYLTLTREHLPDHPPKAFKDAQQLGERELADVEARLPYVSLVVQGAGKAPIRVTRNGEDVPTELLGVPAPINPGEYSFQAFAEGMESTATTVKISDGARETVIMTLRAIPGWKPTPKSEAPTSSPEPHVAQSSLTSDSPHDAAPRSSGRPLLIGSIASFAVGAAGVGLGVVFLGKHSSTSDKSQSLYAQCGENGALCPESSALAQQIQSLDGDARTQLAVSVTSFVVGGLGLAGGVTLLILDSKRNDTAGVGVSPVIGLNYAGVRGSF